MSKKSTSVLALAAMVLLAIPAQAQTFAKQKASNKRLEPTKMVLTTPKALKAAEMKAADTAEGRAFRKAVRRVGEEVDEHGIITTPAEGEEQVYERSGTAYYSSGSSMYIGTQSGSVNIVECSDSGSRFTLH